MLTNTTIIVHIVLQHAHTHAQAIMHVHAHRIAIVGNSIGGVKIKREVVMHTPFTRFTYVPRHCSCVELCVACIRS